MSNPIELSRYRNEVLTELSKDILPFWLKNVIHFESGGFHGEVDGRGVPRPEADKGAILASRILWTFSRAYPRTKNPDHLRAAELMFRYILNHFLDRESGGVFWMLDAHGRPLDSTKKFYAQAFAIYAFSEYFRVSGERRALDEAQALFELIERHGLDPERGGYLDALGRDWTPIADTRLSDRDLNTPKTMNTNLHVLEAYTTLARCAPSVRLVRALEELSEVFLSRIIRPDGHFGLFFEMGWKEVSGTVSYGHDIEGAWLLSEAVEGSSNPDLAQRVRTASLAMAETALREGLDPDDGGLLFEREANGELIPGKEWWPQVEAMVGFFNAYGMTGRKEFLNASLSVWGFCKLKLIRPEGEWHGGVDAQGRPDPDRVIAGPWKCPYHTGRACMEIADRLEKMGF
jgi:cellobiose epimerase